ncbi:Uncharacterised protein [Mycobacteroides abscessus subsp. abscessus]|nr:Uncharacterised protein [Mycobacteroides abscessus subsp. abscessus]
MPEVRPAVGAGEGLPLKGSVGRVCYLHLGVDISSTKASPRRGGEPGTAGTRTRSQGPSTKASPRRGGEPSHRNSSPAEVVPQRRPPHEGEARSRVLPSSAIVSAPQRRPPHEGEARSAPPPRPSSPATLNEGLPTKGRRDPGDHVWPGVVVPSTKASPRRGGESAATCRRAWTGGPQRRPPHEGEARFSLRDSALRPALPQRRPPHEGEARHLR